MGFNQNDGGRHGSKTQKWLWEGNSKPRCGVADATFEPWNLVSDFLNVLTYILERGSSITVPRIRIFSCKNCRGVIPESLFPFQQD